MKVKFILIFYLFVFTSLYKAQVSPDSLDRINLSDSVFVMKKSPSGAMLRSAIIPGWGQIYNESFWKVPIIWSFLGYFVYGWNTSNNYYQDYKNLYSKSLKSSSSGNQAYLKYRNFYRDQRDFFAFYIGLTYFLNIIDAYVDAHLFDFDTEFNAQTETLSLGVRVGL